MKNGNALIFGLLLGCFLAVAANAQEMVKPWEKYGISQSEWKMVQDKKISAEKLKIILSSGISIPEYCKEPWKNLGINEGDWLDKRRAGMSSYDIELEIQSDRTGYKQDNKNTMKSETNSATSKQAAGLFASFLLPGYQQQKLGQKTRGKIMSGLAIGCFAGCFIWSVSEGRFEPIPLFFIVPDMFWSLFDYKQTLRKKESE